jgi:hypothetical protein
LITADTFITTDTLITADLSPRVEPTAEIINRGHGEAREQAGPQEAEQDRAIGADV